MNESTETISKLDNNKEFSIAQRQYKGPVPSPNDLHTYNELIPNGAARFMEMAEKEQAHRHSKEIEIIKQDHVQFKRDFINKTIGQLSALFTLVTLSYLSYYSFENNYPESATKIITYSLISIIGLFITGKVINLKKDK